MSNDPETPRLVETDDANAPSITHLAVVQVYGLCVDNAVKSRGFAEWSTAVRWVRDEVELAHGGIALVIQSVTPFRYDMGGEPQRWTMGTTWIMSDEGPTHGFVLDIESNTAPSGVTL